MKGFTRARLAGVLTLLSCLALPGVAQAQATLTGEELSSTRFAKLTAGSCDPEGTSTFSFEASGVAAGPYPGTFTETGTFTVGPERAVIGVGPITAFEADFTITGPLGTVTGTKTLTVKGFNPGHCSNDGGDLGQGVEQGFRYVTASAFDDLTYNATVITPGGTFTDRGTSVVHLQALMNPFDTSIKHFQELFTSAAQCSDMCDNDSDGQEDYPADPGCSSPTDDTESPDPTPVPATLTVAPKTATNPVGTQHCVTATVNDASGDPVSA